MIERELNLTTKPLAEFQPGDTLYLRKNESDCLAFYYCEFVSVQRGTVTVKVLSKERGGKLDQGQVVTVRPSSCYLWGRWGGDKWERAYWFKNIKEAVL
jgi:hypothetical protein